MHLHLITNELVRILMKLSQRTGILKGVIQLRGSNHVGRTNLLGLPSLMRQVNRLAFLIQILL